jgi:hypothetical protein
VNLFFETFAPDASCLVLKPKGEAQMPGNRDKSNRLPPGKTTREEYEALFRRELLEKTDTVANRNEEVLNHAH